MNILIIDTDVNHRMILEEFLKKRGHTVSLSSSAREALKLIKEKDYDIILSDIYVPDCDKVTYLKMLKRYATNKLIIIYSEDSGYEDEVVVLKLGFDEYVRKCHTFEIIITRIDNAVRRKQARENTVFIESNGFMVDKLKREVMINDVALKLTNTEYELIIMLIENKNAVVTREQICCVVQKGKKNLRVIDVYIVKLRKKLNANCIITIRGEGYVWIET